MGAWGAGNFENDTALDWTWDLKESTGLEMVGNAISDVLNCGDYLDADVGCIGLAAAEVVAASRNKPVGGLPKGVSEWVRVNKISPSDNLVKDCLAAVAKIKGSNISELRELWESGKDPPTQWYSVLDDLISRLQ
jgi:hypothetical protein